MFRFFIIFCLGFILNTIHAQTIHDKIKLADNYFEKGARYLALDVLDHLSEQDLFKSPSDALNYYALKSELCYAVSDAESALTATHAYKKICDKYFQNKAIYFSYSASMYCKYYNHKASADSIIWFAKESMKLWRKNKRDYKLIDSWFVYTNFANARRNVVSLTPQNTSPVTASLFCDTAIALLKKSDKLTSYKLARLYQAKAMTFLDFTTEASQKLFGEKFSKEMWKKSNALLMEAKGLYVSINPKHPDVPQVLSLIALEEFYFGNFEKAINYYDEAEDIILKQGMPFTPNLGWTYATILRWKEWLLVKRNINPTVAELQQRIAVLKSADANWSFIMFDIASKKEDVFSDSYNINPASAIAEDYAKLYLITKKREFIDSAYKYAEKQKYVLLIREGQSRSDLDYFNKTIKKCRLYIDSISLGFEPKVQIKRQEMDSVVAILKNKKRSAITSLEDLQRSINFNQAILYYFINPQQTHAKLHVLIVQKNRIDLQVLSTEKVLDNSSVLLNGFNDALLKSDFQSVKKYGYEIYLNYFETPFSVLDTDVKKLILFPPAFLQRLPVNCVLQDTVGTNFKNTNYVVQKYSLSYQISGYTYLKSIMGNKDKQNNIVLTALSSNYQNSLQNETSYGDFLIEQLKRCFKINSLSPNCNKVQFLSALEKSGAFHFSGHASSVSTLNSLTNLYLTSDSISIFDIYQLDLENNQLCVFNGCLSGTGKTINTEGQNDFARALTMKGCKAQVLNKTKSDDKTSAVILEKFYSLMNEGFSKSEALAEAQRLYLSEADVISSNPMYWNSLFVIGNDQSISFETNNDISKWLLLLLIVGIGLFLILLFKRF